MPGKSSAALKFFRVTRKQYVWWQSGDGEPWTEVFRAETKVEAKARFARKRDTESRLLELGAAQCRGFICPTCKGASELRQTACYALCDHCHARVLFDLEYCKKCRRPRALFPREDCLTYAVAIKGVHFE
jgi:hypothetical protein